MISKLVQWTKDIIAELYPDKSDSAAVSVEMVTEIDTWASVFNNCPKWASKKNQVYTEGDARSVCVELARLTTLELESQVSGSDRAEYINKVYQSVIEQIDTYAEYGMAKGGLIMKPNPTADGITVDFVQADCFVPVSFDSSGRMTAAVFLDTKKRGSKYFRKLEAHNLTQSGYRIINRAYASSTDAILGNEIPLSSVDEWADIAPDVTLPYIKEPLFGYFKVPFSNPIDNTSPLGPSVFADVLADGTLQLADQQYSRIAREYEITEPALFLATEYLKQDGIAGPKLPDGNKRIYREVEDAGGLHNGHGLFEVYSPAIRDTSLLAGLNRYKQDIEFKCGLSYGTLSDIQLVDKTATEIISSKQRSHSTVKKLQKALQTSLEQLVNAIDEQVSLYNLAPEGDYEVAFKWDDSILIDSNTEQSIRMQEVQSGIVKPESYLMWRYGVSEEEAKDMMPDQNTTDYGADLFGGGGAGTDGGGA